MDQLIYLLAGLGIGAVLYLFRGKNDLPSKPDSKKDIIERITQEIAKKKESLNNPKKDTRNAKDVEDYHNNND